MSLILNTDSIPSANIGREGEEQTASHLEAYLAVIETNKQSCEFVPHDALLALDMAGFVSSKIGGAHKTTRISTARMALSLVQPRQTTPVQ